MMKQRLHWFGLAMGVLISQSVLAADSSFYADISVGQSKADLNASSGFTVDDTDTSYSIGAGYNFNQYVSIEGGYLKLGKAKLATSGTVSGTYYGSPFSATGTLSASAEVDGYYFGPVFRLPVNDKFEVFARAGAYFWSLEAVASASGSLTYAGTTYAGGVTAKAKQDGTDAYYGVGAGYKFNDRVSLGVGWTRYDIEGTDVDNISARLKINF